MHLYLLRIQGKPRCAMKREKRPVRRPSTPIQPMRPKPDQRTGSRSSPLSLQSPACAEDRRLCRQCESKRLHSWASRIQVINQVGDSVALVRSSEGDVYYRNDSMTVETLADIRIDSKQRPCQAWWTASKRKKESFLGGGQTHSKDAGFSKSLGAAVLYTRRIRLTR